MAYAILPWKDEVRSPAKTFIIQNNDDGTITLVPAGKELQKGTNMSAANFDNMETGIFAADMTANEAMRRIRFLQDDADAVKGFILEDTLTNSQKFPFNNSKKTIAIPTDNIRNTTDYNVIVEAEAVGKGFVRSIEITDKMVNGFKIAFTGSAVKVNVRCYVHGGM